MTRRNMDGWTTIVAKAEGGIASVEHIRWLNKHAGYGEKNWTWGDTDSYDYVILYIRDPYIATMFRLSI